MAHTSEVTNATTYIHTKPSQKSEEKSYDTSTSRPIMEANINVDFKVSRL
jgi:hypothetical protein